MILLALSVSSEVILEGELLNLTLPQKHKQIRLKEYKS